MKKTVRKLFCIVLLSLSASVLHAEPQTGSISLTMPPVLVGARCLDMIEQCGSKDLCESAQGFWYNARCNRTDITSRQKTEQLAGQWCQHGFYYFLDTSTVAEDKNNPGRFIIAGGRSPGRDDCSFKADPNAYFSGQMRWGRLTGWYDNIGKQWVILDETDYPHCIGTFRLENVTAEQLEGCRESIGYFCGSACSATTLQRISPP